MLSRFLLFLRCLNPGAAANSFLKYSLGLVLIAGTVSCYGPTNSLSTSTARPTPPPIPRPTAPPIPGTIDVNTDDKAKIEKALKKAGFTDVTVDTSTTPATLRGTLANGKTTDMMKVAVKAADKPLKNETSETSQPDRKGRRKVPQDNRRIEIRQKIKSGGGK